MPYWFRPVGIPLQAWTEGFFRSVGDCYNQVKLINEDALRRRHVDVARGICKFECPWLSP